MAKSVTDNSLFPDDDGAGAELFPDTTLFPETTLGFQNTQILHLFEFTLADAKNKNPEIIRFTDNDVFITIDGNEYVPTKISFDRIREDFTLEADKVNILLDGIGQDLSEEIITSQWRNKLGKIFRVTYNEIPVPTEAEVTAALFPELDLFPDDDGAGAELFPTALGRGYESGMFTFDKGYPSIDFDRTAYENKFVKTLLFEGQLDNVTLDTLLITFSITSEFDVWDRPYPSTTFDIANYPTIIDSMTLELLWGS